MLIETQSAYKQFGEKKKILNSTFYLGIRIVTILFIIDAFVYFSLSPKCWSGMLPTNNIFPFTDFQVISDGRNPDKNNKEANPSLC